VKDRRKAGLKMTEFEAFGRKLVNRWLLIVAIVGVVCIGIIFSTGGIDSPFLFLIPLFFFVLFLSLPFVDVAVQAFDRVKRDFYIEERRNIQSEKEGEEDAQEYLRS
jgi:hypothetical protein